MSDRVRSVSCFFFLNGAISPGWKLGLQRLLGRSINRNRKVIEENSLDTEEDSDEEMKTNTTKTLRARLALIILFHSVEMK
jgi:hypothetical protein